MNSLVVVALALLVGAPWELYVYLLSHGAACVGKRWNIPLTGTFAADYLKDEGTLSYRKELLRWAVTASLFCVVVLFFEISSYNMLSLFGAMFALCNLLSYLLPVVFQGWWANEETRYCPPRRLQGATRMLNVAFGFLFFGGFLFSIIGHLPVLQFMERDFVKSAIAPVKNDEGTFTKQVYPERVVEIQRDGSTWYEIYPMFEDRVYAVKEEPGSNRRLKYFSSGDGWNRANLINLSWREESIAEAKSGTAVVEARLANRTARNSQVAELN